MMKLSVSKMTTSSTLIPLSSLAIISLVIADSGGPYIAGSSLLTMGSSCNQIIAAADILPQPKQNLQTKNATCNSSMLTGFTPAKT